jgi:hypothetical protein
LDSFPEWDKKTAISDIYLDGLKGESWVEVSSDDELDKLIDKSERVSHLLVRCIVGNEAIVASDLFKKLDKIAPDHLFVMFEPIDLELNGLLQELKMTNENNGCQISAIGDFLKHKNWLTDIGYEWLRLRYTLHPEDLKSNAIRNFILDLSWLPNIYFTGDFQIKPDSYHVLHPGMHPLQVPATSRIFHRPTFLIKVLADKVEEIEPGSLMIASAC